MYVIDVMTFLVSQQYTPPNVEMCVVGVSAVEVAPSPFYESVTTARRFDGAAV